MLTKDNSPKIPTPFYLLDIAPHLLEKVLNKLNWQTYFKLHKTCKQIGDFTRTSQNIRIYVGRNCHLLWKKSDDGGYKLKIEFRWTSPYKQVDAEDFYGIRFRNVALPREITEEFDLFYAALKKYRITGVRLSLNFNEVPFTLTGLSQSPNYRTTALEKEQCDLLLKFHKPSYLIMNSIGSNQIEAAFPLKNLKEVAIAIEPDCAYWAVKNLLINLERMTVFVHTGGKSLTTEAFLSLVLAILQLLRNTSYSKLRSFTIEIPWRRPVLPLNQLLTTFQAFDPVAKMYARHQEERKIYLKNIRDSREYACEFIMNNFYGKIQYGGMM